MKILLVHCHYRLPGGEDAVFAAERAMLERHGHEVLVYERSNEEAAHGLPKALLPLHAIWNRAAARDVKRIIQTKNVDAVHIHNTLLLLSPAVVRAAKHTGVPVVQTLHNFRLFCPNGILLRGGQVCEDCPHHGLACAVRHRCYRGSLAQTLVVAAAYGLHRLLGTWRGVTMVALTEFDRRKLLEFNRLHPMFDADRLVVKPNPVCVPDGPVTPRENRKNQMLFAGRLEELKGLRTVLEAWRLLGDTAPTLLVAGEGPLGDWARAQNLPNVRFLGQLSRTELHARMAESRAVVAASLCYESFALVPAEAHALGTPVLASDLGNVGASVQPGVDGLRFTPGDANALAGAVRALGQMSFDCNAIAARARSTYSEEENYNALMRFYTKGTTK
ncbi:MAG: glycosyltransferase [Gemmiger sp.]|uniref:glycosyltransferase n=1 Tax=Gemmiger sp. TaxID=2049027 RepID=UPI002A90A91B|nr:glycosyltransferase [Gemmiger sp.]MDY5411628.1 glycosyltransferase [Gemmiger sp.]